MDIKRYSYKEVNHRFRVFDSSERFGTQDICIADCGNDEWYAKVIVYEMNKGLPYRPDISYQDYLDLKEEGLL